MSRNANARIEVGLSSLVREFLPPLPTDEKHLVEEKHQEALEIAKAILDEYGSQLP